MRLTWALVDTTDGGGAVVPVTSLVYTEAEGDGSIEVSATLPNGAHAVGPLSTFTAVMQGAVLVESDKLPSPSLVVERRGRTIRLSIGSRLRRRHRIAPMSTETRDPEPLAARLGYVYQRLGFDEVRTNLPAVALPRGEFQPTSSYHETVQGQIAIFEPVVAEDPVENRIRIIDPDTVTGIPRVITAAYQITRSRPQEPYPIVNDVEVLTAPEPDRTGGVNQFDCPLLPRLDPPDGLELPGGDRVALSTDACGGFVINIDLLESLGAVLVEGEPLTEEVPPTYKKDAQGNLVEQTAGHTTVTTPLYLNFFNNPRDPQEVTRTIEVGSVEKVWATSGDYRDRLVAQTDTAIFYLPGTNFGTSSGQQTLVSGLVKVPGATAPLFLSPLSVETEWITFERRREDGPTDWRKIASRKTRAEWYLKDERVPLQLANLNDTVDSSTTTSQDYDYGLTFVRAERTIPVGTSQIKVAWTEFDELRGVIRSGGARDVLGRNQVDRGATVEPHSKIYLDQLSIADWGHHPRVQLDLQSWGIWGSAVGEWKAARYFSRSGKLLQRESVDVAAPLVDLHRGDLVELVDETRRITLYQDGDSTDFDIGGGSEIYLVLGLQITYANLERGKKPQAVTRLELVKVEK